MKAFKTILAAFLFYGILAIIAKIMLWVLLYCTWQGVLVMLLVMAILDYALFIRE